MLPFANGFLRKKKCITEEQVNNQGIEEVKENVIVEEIMVEKKEEKKVMVEELYPENLKGLDLSFEESIYAIVFGLQDEIRQYGKEKVFQELGFTKDEMHSRVEHCLQDAIYKDYAHALRLVLNRSIFLVDDMSANEDLKNDFQAATDTLRGPNYNKYGWRARNYRYLLVQDTTEKPRSVLMPQDTSARTKDLCVQVEQLMAEVRFYDERRDQALARIEQIMTEIRQERDCLKDVPNFEPVESGEQIVWPYRSAKVIHDLGLKTTNEIVNYFGSFEHFLESKCITLLEWWVIVEILCRKGLRPRSEYPVNFLSEIDELEWSVRVYSGLKRSGICNFEDVAVWFADGAQRGLSALRNIRNCGIRSYEEIIRQLGEAQVELDETMCYPTPMSHVRALDFDQMSRTRLSEVGIETIGELLMACQNENRFRGLRYVDNNLYCTAMEHLKKYGLIG